MQQLKPVEYSQRRRYVEWVLEQQAVYRNFSNKLFFSNEVYLTLVGCVNKQNYGIWGTENSQVIEETLQSEKVAVWCALYSKSVIGPYFFGFYSFADDNNIFHSYSFERKPRPYFFENDEGTTVTVNSKRYGYMATDFFLPAIEEYDLENMWFQQDGATCHM